ncbi:hypothetical protein [Vibrio neptunius]|uniref:Uncharacterized protein n=1 Tax=Vibrio neptunius TaxID=170651 RepID=A0ABS3A3X4_9VIBR|nr:hypothetical protein [Vibrio neptunius]MBN3493958.1 hypothetical protein [Vibrio neptunius]MBN3516454.1 hypothetical protein [Vibrio neptunius]MBN3550574.1 hypothetical protein [Vibrio neptunius]MBN3578705.1 hypothetical protein [Vibrio neptunius]MCH9872370.1 hypothetical protein [Vibrio neptunius]
MIKTFHHKVASKSDKSQNLEDDASSSLQSSSGSPKVKQFFGVASSRNKNDESAASEESLKDSSKSENGFSNQGVDRKPSVLFSNKIKSIQSDVVDIDESLIQRIELLCEKEFNGLVLSKGEHLIISNIKSAINFDDPSCQIEFGSQLSKRFQDVQGFLSDYAKIGKVDRILELGKVIIELAKSIDINIFNPNKISTKISSFLGSKKQKIRKLKFEFDSVSDRIDLRINRIFDNLNETHTTLDEFRKWSQELSKLQSEVRLNIIALTLIIESRSGIDSQINRDLPELFRDGNKEALKRWDRKLNNLKALGQSIELTFPQMELYTSNLVTSFERLEEIKVNIIQVWKQQFLSVIAVDESNDATIYYELNDIQETLIKNIEDLQ